MSLIKIGKDKMRKNNFKKYIKFALLLCIVEQSQAMTSMGLSEASIAIKGATKFINQSVWNQPRLLSPYSISRCFSKKTSVPLEHKYGVATLDFQKWNPIMQKEYREDLSRRDQYASVLAVERAEGHAEGVENVAKKMLSMNIDIQTISNATGLCQESIDKLKS